VSSVHNTLFTITGELAPENKEVSVYHGGHEEPLSFTEQDNISRSAKKFLLRDLVCSPFFSVLKTLLAYGSSQTPNINNGHNSITPPSSPFATASARFVAPNRSNNDSK
jgi:hypothetical protein